MKEFGSHLLFHLGAIVLGAAIGVAGTFYWRDGDLAALGLCAAALVFGLVLLLVQNLYINNKDATDRRRMQERSSPRTPARPAPQSSQPRRVEQPRAAPAQSAPQHTAVWPTAGAASGTNPDMEAVDPDAQTRAAEPGEHNTGPTRQVSGQATDEASTGIIDDTGPTRSF
ncbi:hypothetical protein GIY23_08510 [Allosaccharopolyspora coralli]|uniref:Uncharacterized protein n=1 Tax=Allosaccharopolyspora coralli TaxID=2665642 RepID=A0A5Q3Q6T7_9PSEU|nr:hypothetical protein [Allosaccharopolyspora coralli]QGK69560.1 hypothetical protein GIY23_08510 [Allosaccharopolyspora coralli]